MTDEEEPTALDAWETLAEHYASRIDTKFENAYVERPATLSLLPDVNGKRILDAGCGPGLYSEWLADHGADVVALDFSPKMVRLARRRLPESVEIHLADLSRPLDFLQDESFDLALSPLVMDYIKDWKGVFKEVNRVLKSHGTFIFSACHPFAEFQLRGRGSYFDTEFIETWWGGFGIRLLVPSYRRSLEEMISPLLESGFVLERVVEPRPIGGHREDDPETYETLSKRPGFICFRARKATKEL